MGNNASPNSAVIPRESGVSSTPRLLRIAAPSLEYWIARSRGQWQRGCATPSL